MEREALGVDIGGTFVKAGRVAADGRVARDVTLPSRALDGALGPVEAVAAAVSRLLAAPDEPIAIGVGAPGAVDPATGALVGRTPHLPDWNGFPLRAHLAEHLGREVVVDNDANFAALAEHAVGGARGTRVSLTVTLGTGVGCGIVVDGAILRGAWGGAGELGHLPLGDGRTPCACGVEGCVEPEMSGSGLVRAAAAAGLEAADAAAVFAAAAAGDPRAVKLVDRFGDRLGAAIATAVNLINPEVVVIGGGVGRAGEPLLARVRAALERYALPSHRGGLRVVAAALGPQAGLVGAALAARAALSGR